MEIINITDEIIEVNVTEAVVNVVTQTGAYPLPSNVFSVFGRVGNVVGQAGDYNTDLVGEGLINKYYTDARSRAAISENITGLEYSSASGIFSLAIGYLIPTQAMLDAKVPYTGATGNVALGEHQIQAGQVQFDQTPTGAAGVGVLRWNNTDGTLDLGLKGGNVTLQIGQEQLKRVVNGSGINLTEAGYQVVKVSGAQGQRLQVALAQANNDLNSATTLGVVTENIYNNQEGFITTSGEVRGINTTGSLQGETWNDGDVLYLSPTTAGKLTNIKPTAPNHMVIVGYVEYAHQNNGKIFVKVDNGYEIGELHDVDTTGETTNDGLFLDSDNVWRPKTIAEVLGYTPVTSARTISTTAPLTGGGDLSADRTISMPAATTSASGYLTSTDWNTFNAKQPLITAGTTAQYYRGDKTFQTLDTLAVAENTNLYYTQARFDTAFSGKSTTNLAEGTNLYFTTARAQAAISGTAPISVSGGVVSISQASGASNGYLSSTDWNTFNAKQAALNGTGFVKINGTTISYDNSTYLTTISGITAGGELSGTYPNPTLVNSAVTGKVLTGLNLTGGGTIADTDSILSAFGKVQNQISALVGGVMYQSTWNASTNTPSITSSVGTKGHYYIVSVAGSTNINGITDWKVGDWIIFNGTSWDKVDNTDAVSSVNGYTGAVSLVTSDVAESGNLYFTNARAIASTLTGYTSGAGTITSSDTILQAIQKLNGNVSGLVTGVSSVFGRTGAVTAQSGDYTTTQVTEGTNLYYTEARVSANTDVAANTAARHAAVTLGTANGLSLSTQQLSLALASGSTTGALSSTDWNTFNNKADDSLVVKLAGTQTITGSKTFNASFTAGTTALFNSGILLKDGATSVASGYFAIQSLSSTTLNFTSSGNRSFDLIMPTSGGAITMPNGSGTLALTSNLSSYLSLSGGTLTGPLNGTSATFSSSVTAGGRVLASGGSTNAFSGSNNSASEATLYVNNANAAGFGVYSAGGINYFGGNVGIGTTSPSTSLHVFRGSSSGSIANFEGASNENFVIGINNAENYIYTTANGKGLSFYVDDVKRFQVRSNGNICVGGDDAGEKFNITQGNIKLYTYNNIAGQYRYIGSEYSEGNGNNKAEIRFGIESDTYTYLSFHTANGANTINERMRITSGGNIEISNGSIGNGSGDRSLQMFGSSSVSNNDSAAIHLSQVWNGISYRSIISAQLDPAQGAASSCLVFKTAFFNGTTSQSVERMRITTGGNVGIGISSPQDKLDVNGSIRFRGNTPNFTAVTDNAVMDYVPTSIFSTDPCIRIAAIGTSSVGAGIRFITGTSTPEERVRITSAGTLGIAGSSDVNNAQGMDKLSIGFLASNYGWIQSYAGTTLYLNKLGNAVYAGTQRIDNNSDARIKENIVSIENALDVVLSLNGRKFNMLDENNILRYGFVAQEVKPYLADFVTESNRKFEKGDLKIENLLTLESSGAAWGALLVEAIKEQQKIINELKAKIA